MSRYLIEFRFQGSAKHEIKQLIWHVDRKFRLGKANRHRPVPHITLAGPFYTRDERRMVREVARLCMTSPLMHFRIKGYNHFENSGVVYIDIKPSKELEDWRWKLANALRPFCDLTEHDVEEKFMFHSTLAMKLDNRKFEQVRRYAKSLKQYDHDYYLTRVTIIKDKKILREYDFLQRKLLKRQEAKSRSVLSKTFDLLKRYMDGFYDPDQFIDRSSFRAEGGVLNFAKKKMREPKTFLISDIHFGHANIIRYCQRPFKDVEEMNQVIMDNWNSIVDPKDTVIVVGDLGCWKGKNSPAYWAKKLNGKIVLVEGNHDESLDKSDIIVHDTLELEHRGVKFILNHYPDTPHRGAWLIHGHKHNNDLENCPFINGKKKTINVSAELLNFKPLDLDTLFDLHFQNIEYMMHIGAKPKFTHKSTSKPSAIKPEFDSDSWIKL